METKHARGFQGYRVRERDESGKMVRGHVSGCKYNRRVSRGEVKWPWRAGARRIGCN